MDEQASKHRGWYVVNVFDTDHPDYLATFEYAYIGDGLGLVGFGLRPSEPEPTALLSAASLRTLPVGAWDRAARAVASATMRTARSEHSRKAAAGVEVFRVHPDASKMDTRRYAAAVKQAEVANRYRALVLAGVSNPSAVIAQERGISANAARQLIVRARRAGYLGPAAGRTAGESGLSREGE